MKIIINTMLAALMLLLGISCKKESATLPSSRINGDESSMSNDIISINALSVKIGTQVWMNKNLSVTKYRNGDPIPQVKNNAQWATLTTGAWCWLNNDPANSIYGRLYNWYAVNDPRGLAPAGWHIASDSEWTVLTTFLGGDSIAGGKMKSGGTFKDGTGLWRAPNTAANNSSGFTGLPGGWRLDDGSFHSSGDSTVGYGIGLWWTATVNVNSNSTHSSWHRGLVFDAAFVRVHWDGQRDGCSVRCVKD